MASYKLMLIYVYDSVIGDLLNNKGTNYGVRYNDIDLLDRLFNYYISLVYTYKQNNRPTVIEYTCFININRDTVNSWINNDTRGNITSDYSVTAKRWHKACEMALVDDRDTIKSLFLLKANYGYRDTPTEITIKTDNTQQITADALPELLTATGHDIGSMGSQIDMKTGIIDAVSIAENPANPHK